MLLMASVIVWCAGKVSTGAETATRNVSTHPGRTICSLVAYYGLQRTGRHVTQWCLTSLIPGIGQESHRPRDLAGIRLARTSNATQILSKIPLIGGTGRRRSRCESKIRSQTTCLATLPADSACGFSGAERTFYLVDGSPLSAIKLEQMHTFRCLHRAQCWVVLKDIVVRSVSDSRMYLPDPLLT